MVKRGLIKLFLLLTVTSITFGEVQTQEFKPSLRTTVECWLHFFLGLFYRDQYRYDEAIEEFEKAIELNPNFYQAHNELGVVYRKKGKVEPAWGKAQRLYEEAVVHHKKAIEINPNYEVAHASLGYTYICMGRYESAMREFVEALKINPSSDRAHLGLGWVYDEMDLCDKAIEEYQKAIKLDPKNEAAYNNLGWAYAKKGEFDAAIKSLKKAIRLDKDFALAYNNLGEVYLHKKMFIEASQNLERSISLGYKNPYTHIFLYLALLSRGEKEDAKREYKKIFTLFPDKASAHRAIGWVYHRYERYKDALKEYKRALEINPNKAYWWYELGNIYRDIERYNQALLCYQKALQKDAKFCSAWHEAARVFALQGEEEKTLFNIKKAIDNYPLLECCRLHWLSEEDPLAEYITRIVEENLLDFAWFYGFMGRVFEKSRDPQALSMYKKAIALAPNNSKVSTAYEGIGRIYREKGKYKEAIEYFNKSMEVKPSSPYGYYQIASIYYIQGENLKAINEYEKALEKKKGAYAYLCIGHCWEKEGEIDKAISFYKKAIESFPADPYAPTINRQIHLLEALSRLRLLPLYRWARRTETRMERELARRGLTSRIERITERIRVIYKSKSPMEWIGIGLTILVVFFGIAALGITYLIKRKKIIKPSPERMA